MNYVPVEVFNSVSSVSCLFLIWHVSFKESIGRSLSFPRIVVLQAANPKCQECRAQAARRRKKDRELSHSKAYAKKETRKGMTCYQWEPRCRLCIPISESDLMWTLSCSLISLLPHDLYDPINVSQYLWFRFSFSFSSSSSSFPPYSSSWSSFSLIFLPHHHFPPPHFLSLSWSAGWYIINWLHTSSFSTAYRLAASL